MVLGLDPGLRRLLAEAERSKEKRETGTPVTPIPTVQKPPTAHPITHQLPNPIDEFKPSARPHIPEAHRVYARDIDRLLKTDPSKQPEVIKPPTAPKPRPEEEKERREREKREAQDLLRRIEEAGKEAAQNFEAFLKGAVSWLSMTNPFARLGLTLAHAVVDNKAKQENAPPEQKDVIRKVGEIIFRPETVMLENAPRAAQHIRDVINGTLHAWFGGGDPVDMARERAAISATGTLLQQAGALTGALGGAAAATIVGAPAGAAIGGLGGAMALTGWYMQDNLTFYLDKRLNEIKQNIKDRIKAIERAEEEERRAEERRRQQEEEREAWKQNMMWYLEEKRKFEEQSREEWARIKEEDRKRWEELRRASEEREAAKRAEYAKFRRMEAASDRVKRLLSGAKEVIDSADTAWFNKNPDLARQLLERAKQLYDEAKQALAENKDILDEYDMYEALMTGLDALKSILDAKALVYYNSNPADKVRDAVNRMARYAYHSGRSNARAARRIMSKPTLTVDDILALVGLYQHEVKTNVLLEQAANLMDQAAQAYQVIPVERPPLRWETIIKFRAWLASNIKTPLAQIPNYLWNKASGINYTPEMIRLIYDALRSIPVMLEEVAGLDPADLEAILRARQYLYAAAKRGYFNPWEYELYCRLKRLLMLTDHQAAKLFKLYIPLRQPIKRGVTLSV
jgi:hypothetical protein